LTHIGRWHRADVADAGKYAEPFGARLVPLQRTASAFAFSAIAITSRSGMRRDGTNQRVGRLTVVK